MFSMYRKHLLEVDFPCTVDSAVEPCFILGVSNSFLRDTSNSSSTIFPPYSIPYTAISQSNVVANLLYIL